MTLAQTPPAVSKLMLEVVCNGISEKAAILRSERESRQGSQPLR